MKEVTTRQLQTGITKLLEELPVGIVRYGEVVAVLVKPTGNEGGMENSKKINNELFEKVKKLEAEIERLEALAMGSHAPQDLDDEEEFRRCEYPFHCDNDALREVEYGEYDFEAGEVKYKKLWLCDKHIKENEKNMEEFDEKGKIE